ncbi:MAG TPA: type II toxin-antitoxin system HicB family antitoxin [Solirubrobacterales bacterium]|jgi:predicted RNase H-like HicB family nuclease|nr:type II toxin-antitoxin system HicB family antitoxin [Solirubrobacterales bacterium]
MNDRMELTVNVHMEDGSYWADVPKLPGCFAAGDTLDELLESLREGIELYLSEEESAREVVGNRPFMLTSAVLSDAASA